MNSTSIIIFTLTTGGIMLFLTNNCFKHFCRHYFHSCKTTVIEQNSSGEGTINMLVKKAPKLMGTEGYLSFSQQFAPRFCVTVGKMMLSHGLKSLASRPAPRNLATLLACRRFLTQYFRGYAPHMKAICTPPIAI
jgi:hypothetical protein